MSHGSRIGLLQICLTGVLWGTIGLAVALVREQDPLSVLSISAWRLSVATAVLVAVLLARRGLPRLVALLRARPQRALVVGAATAAFQVLYFASVTQVGVTVATVIALGLGPVLLTTSESVVERRAPGPGTVLTVVTALAGLVLVSVSAGHEATGPNPVAGSLLAVGSGAAYALATGASTTLARMTDPMTLATATMSVATALMLPLALVLGGRIVTTDVAAIGLLVWLGVATMAVAYALLYAGLRTTSGSAAVVATLLEPVVAALLAAALLGERVGVTGVLGTALILLAVGSLARRPPVPAKDGVPVA